MTSKKHPLKMKYSMSLTGEQWDVLFYSMQRHNCTTTYPVDKAMITLKQKIASRIAKFNSTEKKE